MLGPADKADWDRLAARYLRVLSPQDRGRGQHDIIDLQGTLLTWMREHQVRVVAVRPDRFVAASDANGLAVPLA